MKDIYTNSKYSNIQLTTNWISQIKSVLDLIVDYFVRVILNFKQIMMHMLCIDVLKTKSISLQSFDPIFLELKQSKVYFLHELKFNHSNIFFSLFKKMISSVSEFNIKLIKQIKYYTYHIAIFMFSFKHQILYVYKQIVINKPHLFS